jgi:hypothetical protein
MGSSEAVRASGVVKVGPLEFVAEELSIEGEAGILAHLRKRAKESLGPGSFWANALPALDWLREKNRPVEAAALTAETARLVATNAPVTDDQLWDYRETPDGVADELFLRTRRTHPNATRAEMRAGINEANALEVRLQMVEAVNAKKAPTPSGSSPSS